MVAKQKHSATESFEEGLLSAPAGLGHNGAPPIDDGEQDVGFEYVRPWTYPKQTEAIFCPERYGLIEASTKTGKTAGCILWLYEEALRNGAPGRNFWWVAPVSAQALIAFRRMKRGLDPALYDKNETERTITLFNGAVIHFKSADNPDSLYGEDVFGAVIDEASRVKDTAWFAVRSTLTATRGRIRIIGNVKGRKNWFYMLCRRAESGDASMKFTKLTAYDAVQGGILDAAEVEDAKRQLPEQVFNELYLAIPSDDGGNPFGLGHVNRCIKPLSKLAPKCWGWDLAKSVDYTVGIALDVNGDVCRVIRFQKPWRETKAAIRVAVGNKPALVDSTGVGDPILEDLQREGTEKPRENFEGFKFSSTSKQQLMEGLQAAIQQQEIGYPDGVIVAELSEFEYVYTRTGVKYSAPSGFHDDCVMALALARKAFNKPAPYFDVWTA